MALYIGITIWVFLVLLMGLRPDSVDAAGCWPIQPNDKLARSNKLIASAFTVAAFLLLWFLTAFRSSEIGRDTQNYLWYFNHFANGLDNTSRLEPGYQLLNYCIGKITRDRHVFLIIMATLMYGGVGLYIFMYSRNTAVSVCLFYCIFFSVYTSILRQGIAMIIALYGYQLLKNGKNIPAAMLFLLAMSFHTTAIVCFLLFLDLEILKNRWFVLCLTVLCAGISLTGVLKTAVDAIVPRYTHYFEGQYASSGWAAISFYLLSYIVFYFLVGESLKKNNEADKGVAANFTFLLILTAFGYAVNLFERAGEYYMLIAVTELPNVLYRGKVKNYRLWLFGICTVYLIFFVLILLYRPEWSHLYPYEFWHYTTAT